MRDLTTIAANFPSELKKTTLTTITIISYTKYVNQYIDYCKENELDPNADSAVRQYLDHRLATNNISKLHQERRAIGYLFQMAGYSDDLNPGRQNATLEAMKKPSKKKFNPRLQPTQIRKRKSQAPNDASKKTKLSSESSSPTETTTPLKSKSNNEASSPIEEMEELIHPSIPDNGLSPEAIEEEFYKSSKDKDELLDTTNILVKKDSKLAMDYYNKYGSPKLIWTEDDALLLNLIVRVFSLLCITENSNLNHFYDVYMRDYTWKTIDPTTQLINLLEILELLLIECDGKFTTSFYNKYMSTLIDEKETLLDYKTATKIEIMHGFLKKDCFDFAKQFYFENLQ